MERSHDEKQKKNARGPNQPPGMKSGEKSFKQLPVRKDGEREAKYVYVDWLLSLRIKFRRKVPLNHGCKIDRPEISVRSTNKLMGRQPNGGFYRNI